MYAHALEIYTEINSMCLTVIHFDISGYISEPYHIHLIAFNILVSTSTVRVDRLSQAGPCGAASSARFSCWLGVSIHKCSHGPKITMTEFGGRAAPIITKARNRISSR